MIIGIGVVIILLAIAIFLLGKRVTAWIKARMIKGYTPDGRTIVNRCLFAPLILFAGILLVWMAVHGEQAGHISTRCRIKIKLVTFIKPKPVKLQPRNLPK